jgi:hypothetical protein
MAFILENAVPWGRTRAEYIKMFSLSEMDLIKKIAGFGDGPASFNYESTIVGGNITSFDIIYQFTKEQIEEQVYKAKDTILKQLRNNMQNYNWSEIKDINVLEEMRMNTMRLFLNDFDKGKNEGRYIYHELPNKTKFQENTFDIGLSSHFLLIFTGLGYDFHIQTINEMLRICKEIRITPIVDLNGRQSELTEKIIEYYIKTYKVELVTTSYEF